jgi:hypothetical protein
MKISSNNERRRDIEGERERVKGGQWKINQGGHKKENVTCSPWVVAAAHSFPVGEKVIADVRISAAELRDPSFLEPFPAPGSRSVCRSSPDCPPCPSSLTTSSSLSDKRSVLTTTPSTRRSDRISATVPSSDLMHDKDIDNKD